MRHLFRICITITCCWPLALQSQSATIDGEVICLPVVAKSGVNVRDTPSLEGKKLVAVPFGECLEAIDDPYYDVERDPDTLWIDGLKGKWLQVKYKGITGYAFDAFFGPRHEMQSLGDNAFAFFYEGGDCNTPLLPLHKLPYQYGLYDLGNGTMEIRKVQLSYHFSDAGYGYRWLAVETEESDKSKFLLVSKTELKTGHIDGFFPLEHEGSTLYARNVNDEPLAPFYIPKYELGLGILPDPDPKKQRISKIILTIAGKKQTLYTCDPKSEEHWEMLWFDWVGDLDRDGKLDVIITRGRYYAAFTEIWLSSRAKPGDLVGRVATRFESGCC